MFKLLLILIIIVLIARSVRGLIRAVLLDRQAPPRMPPPPRPDRQPRWQGPAPRTTRPDADVEDARWVDLD